MPLARVVSEAEATHAKASVKRSCSTAKRTTIVLPHLELIGSLCLNSKTCLGQWKSPSWSAGGEWHSEQLKQGPAFFIRLRVGYKRDGKAPRFLDFVRLDLRENNLFSQA